MKKSDIEILGDQAKYHELKEGSRRAEKGYPLLARIDGRAFHTFTKGLHRPYDTRLASLFHKTMLHIFSETNPLLGYHQSDEISFYWFISKDSESDYVFNGRFQKLVGVLASLATSFFVKHLKETIPEKQDEYPVFDCRVWSAPRQEDVFNYFLWREHDAVKNSISMLAQDNFSPKELQYVGSHDKKEMLRNIGQPWEARHWWFKRGAYAKRVESIRVMTPEEQAKMPERYRVATAIRAKPTIVEPTLLIEMTPEEKEQLLSPVLKDSAWTGCSVLR